MHELGTLIWVILVTVGLVSSIVSTARKSRPVPRSSRASHAPAPAQQRLPQRGIARGFVEEAAQPIVPPAPPASVRTVPQAANRAFEHPPADSAAPRGRIFATGRRALVRAVVAAEILGKPLALRDE
jgi:hypothetical protein